MPRRTTFKLPGFSTWVDNIKNEVSREAARQITTDLKEIGPYWSGDFEEAWVVKQGSSPIKATKQPFGESPSQPYTRQVTPVSVPPAKGRKSVQYTIGNEMSYRNVAMDLEPDSTGKYRGERKGRTVEPDWYRTYAEGGNLRLTLQQTTNKVSKNPKIRGFRGK